MTATVGGSAEQHAARADKWLDAYQLAVTYLEPEKMRAAYVWAVGMGSTDIGQSMSDWLLDGLVASRKPAGKRIGTDCAHLHNGDPYACPRCDWTSSDAAPGGES